MGKKLVERGIVINEGTDRDMELIAMVQQLISWPQGQCNYSINIA